MSSVNFFPITWFEDHQWKSVQVLGRLENNRSVYIRIGFRPYFTVRYPPDHPLDQIEENHSFMTSQTPVDEIKQLEYQVYRIYTRSREDYFNGLTFYKKNGSGQIVDADQEIKSKFFAERRLSPGSWQQATDLKTLIYNVTSNTHYTSADLEYFTYSITSISPPSTLLPSGKIAFFDIEAIPADDVSFPDEEADEPPDNIFAISLVLVQGRLPPENHIFFLTETTLPEYYQTSPIRTTQSYNVHIHRFPSEKEMLTGFFDALAQFRPDRLVGYNSRRFDLNYIGEHVKLFKITLLPFTKIMNYIPTFYPKHIVQKRPFYMEDDILALSTPSINQVDLLDFYRRIYPQLGNHKLETISQLLLGRGKTGLSIKEMFAKYRRATPEDLLEIIDYSVMDSLLLQSLWDQSRVEAHLAKMADFWKNDSEYVLTHEPDDLFDDLLRYITYQIPQKSPMDQPPVTERSSGIHRDVYVYSLSEIYLTFLEQLQNPLTNLIVEYFRGSDEGVVPFKSGYFPLTFAQVQEFIRTQLKTTPVIWTETSSVAVSGPPRKTDKDLGPIPYFPLLDYIPLLLVSGKSWIAVSENGLLFKQGMSAFVRPSFKLIDKYVDYIIRYLLENPKATGKDISLPIIQPQIEDYFLEMKVTADEFTHPPPKKQAIIQQLRELGTPVSQSWRKVRYLQTTGGPVVEEIFSKAPSKYLSSLDIKFYNQKLLSALKPILV